MWAPGIPTIETPSGSRATSRAPSRTVSRATSRLGSRSNSRIGSSRFRSRSMTPDHLQLPSQFGTRLSSAIRRSLTPGGNTDTIKEQIYQTKLMILFVQKGKVSFQNILMGAETKDHQNFDDMIIDVENYGKRFLQAKYRASPLDIDFSMLFDEAETTMRNYSLYKYFEHYLKIKTNPDFQDTQDLIVCTNNGMKDTELDVIEVVDDDKPTHKIYLHKVTKPDEIFGDYEFRFKLMGANHKQNTETKNCLRMHFLATELLHCFRKESDCSYIMLRAYRKFLNTDVFNEASRKFYYGFRTGSNRRTAFLHNIMSTKTNFKGRLTLLDEIYQGHTNDSGKLDKMRKQMDAHLHEFMKDFLIVVKFEMQSIDDKVIQVLQKDYDLENTKQLGQVFEFEIIKWLMKTKQGEEMDFGMIENCYDQVKNKLTKVHKKIEKAMVPFRDENIHFEKNPPELKSFLMDKATLMSERICFIKTLPGETFYTSLRIFQDLKTSPQDTYLFLQTSLKQEEIKEGIEIFDNEDSFNLCILECDEGDAMFQENKEKLFQILEENPNKKLLIIGDRDICPDDPNIKYLSQEGTKMNDITKESMEEVLKTWSTSLQNETILFDKLIDHEDQELLDQILLKDLERNKKIGNGIVNSETYDRDLFIPKILVHDFKIRRQILRDDYKMPFEMCTCDESEFEEWCTNHPENNIHLLHKHPIVSNKTAEVTYKLLWRKSKGNLLKLRKYFEGNDASLEIEEYSQRITIIVDAAGMDKVSYLNYTAELLKKKYPDNFIVNTCLNEQPKFFEDKEFKDDEAIEKFLAVDCLGLENEFQELLFRQALHKTGKCHVILDGLDELNSDYDKKFQQLVKFVMKSQVCSTVVSVRAELSEKFEKEFHQYKHIFLPFNEDNQTEYLVKYWEKMSKEEDKVFLQEFTKKIIGFVNTNISDYQKSFSGVPLLTRMVAEIFENNISELKNVENFQFTNFTNVYELYNCFMMEKLRIFSRDSSNISLKNGYKTEASVKELYERLAVQKTLTKEEFEFLGNDCPELTQEEHLIMQKCGIVSGTEKNPHFIHKSFGEYLMVSYIMENIRKESVALLLLNAILKERKYKVARSFLNCVIAQEFKEETFKVYGKIIRENFENYEPAFRLVAKEQHVKIFEFLFASLISGDCDLEEIEKTLLRKENILYDYFRWNHEELNILNRIEERFPPEFLKKLLEHKFQFKEAKLNIRGNLLYIYSRQGRNCLKILRWIRDNVKEDFQFMRQTLSYKGECSRVFLLEIIESFTRYQVKPDVDVFCDVLEELKEIANLYEQGFVEDLILGKDDKGCGLLFYLVTCKVDAHGISKILDLLKELFGLKIVKRLMTQKNESRESFWKILWMKEQGFSFGEVRDYFRRIFLWMDQQFQDADEFEVLAEEEEEIKVPESRSASPESSLSSEPIKVKQKPKILPQKVKVQLRESPSLKTLEKLALEKMLRRSKFPDLFGPDENFIALSNESVFFFEILKEVNHEFEFSDDKFVDYLVAVYILENFEKDYVGRLMLFMLGTKTFPQITEKLNIHVKELKTVENLQIYGKLLQEIAEFNRPLFRFAVEHKNIFVFIVEALFQLYRDEGNLIAVRHMLFLTDENGNTLMHVFSQHYRFFQQIFVERFRFVRTKLSLVDFEELLLVKNEDGKIFIHFVEDKDIFDELLRFLILTTGEEFVKQVLMSKDNLGNTFLYYLISCPACDIDQCLNAVNECLGLEFLKQLLIMLNKKGQNFLFYFRFGNMFYESNLMKALNYIHLCYPSDADLFKQLLNKKDKSDVKFLNHFRNKLENKDANKIPRWLAQRFDRKIVDEILGIRKRAPKVVRK